MLDLRRKMPWVLAGGMLILLARPTRAQRQMEQLGRGVVAIHQGGGRVYVSWRMLGTDPDETTFNLYRQSDGLQPVRLNREPLTKSTNYVDQEANLSQTNAYFVRPVLAGKELEPSASFRLAAQAPEKVAPKIAAPGRGGYATATSRPPGFLPHTRYRLRFSAPAAILAARTRTKTEIRFGEVMYLLIYQLVTHIPPAVRG